MPSSSLSTSEILMISLLYIPIESTSFAASPTSLNQSKLIWRANIGKWSVIVEACVSGELGNAVVCVGMELISTTTDIGVLILRRTSFLFASLYFYTVYYLKTLIHLFCH